MPGQAAASSPSGIQQYRKEQFLISTDPAKLDVAGIHAFLSKSFWDSEGVSRETVERSIRVTQNRKTEPGIS